MKISKETEKDIAQLQLLEQNLQQFLAQRQAFQMQQLEIENALKEIELTKEKPFKVVGNVMVETTKESLKTELSSKKELVEMRIKSIETQEAKIKEKADSLQKSIVRELQKEEGK
jgi:prefoldin beta subunit